MITLLSSETSDIGEEAEVLLDAILGALSSKETMDRFVSALVGIPEIKAKLIEHIVPSLENRIALQKCYHLLSTYQGLTFVSSVV
jgi:hypothetical protein